LKLKFSFFSKPKTKVWFLQQKLNLNLELAQIHISSSMLVSGTTTAHRQLVSNFMLKAAIQKLLMMLDLVDLTTSLQNGKSRDVEWYANKTTNLMKSMPNGRSHIVLLVGDTVAEQICMFNLVDATCPWVNSKLGICHGTNWILTVIIKIDPVATIMAEALKVIYWFINNKVQMVVFKKNSQGRASLVPVTAATGSTSSQR
jgi:hypothetical protein